MINVVFVCLGNICRSPMAELIFKKILADRGLTEKFSVTSCGTSSCEAGSPIYPPARNTLAAHGITGSHTARKITRADFENSDYILVMDSENLSDLHRVANPLERSKIHKLCSFTSRPRDVADPWYTRDFETTYRDIVDGCNGFLEYLNESTFIS